MRTRWKPGFSGVKSGFTLIEVTLAFAIISISLGAIFAGYTIAARQAQWTAYSMAAQALAMKRLEQVVSAPWIPQSGIDNLVASNFPATVEFLSLPTKQTNIACNATNFTTVSLVSTDPPLKMVQVDCIWVFQDGKVFTNSVATYHAPAL